MEKKEHESLLRYCRNQCTEAERKQIERACETSEELRREIGQLRLTLEIADDIREMEAMDIQHAYGKVQNKIRNERRKGISRQWMRYAAIWMVPLLCSTLVLGYLYQQELSRPTGMTGVRTSAGTVTRYELPDGSVVWLNANTLLEHPVRFDRERREVRLNGEAYFDIQASEKEPFYVHTDAGVSIYVYGTRFNVNAYGEDSYIETVLEEGKVNVIAPDQGSTIRLQPGERLLYDKEDHHLTKTNVDVYEKTAWKEGKLIFRNAPLDEVLKRLSRHFNVEIEFHNLSDRQYNYRATFQDEPLSQILDYLSRSAKMEWNVEEGIQQTDESFTRKRIIVRLY